MRPQRSPKERAVSVLVTGLVAFLVVLVTMPVAMPWAKDEVGRYEASRPETKRQYGHWDQLPVPEEFRVNAIHAAVLRTGKVLIIAGSGNNREAFEAGTFKTLLWDPKTNDFELVHTPTDLFCGGHAQLPDGRLLIAGGTQKYEKLADDVDRAAGPVTVVNRSTTEEPFVLPAGTTFTSPGGQVFKSTTAVTVPPATTDERGEVEVWAEAVHKGGESVVEGPARYAVGGLGGARAENVHATAERLTRDKQEYQGDDKSYLFDPETERYERVGDLELKRWYPTLVGLEDGKVLAVSGLDGFGRIIQGHNELFDPKTKRWEAQPDLNRYFPTYPSLFLMGNGKLFYSGSNAGYGPEDRGRTPGIWDVEGNLFDPVPGLRDPDQTETSASVLLPPAQTQKVMVAGGGGVGDSRASTARTDVVDLTDAKPRFRPGPDLAAPTRYCNLVLTPDDRVLVTGGSRDYRGRGNSDHHLASFYDPDTNTMAEAAAPEIGRNYHASAVLLPDGRVVTLGSDPLYNEDDTGPGTFEQRIEVYSPPYLFQDGPRPALTDGPTELERGGTASFDTPRPEAVATARLVRPSAVTHVTDPEQRSIALDVERKDGGVALSVPKRAGLVPSGWYMLFVADERGVPSEARWVHVA